MDPVQSQPAIQPISLKRTIVLLTVLCIIIAGAFALTQRQLLLLQAKMSADQTVMNDRLDQIASSSAVTSASVKNLYVVFGTQISDEQKKNQAIQDELGKVSNTVVSLDKLSKSDAQLMKKYSKIYFLNEHYAPVQVVNIDSAFAYNKNTTYQIHAQVAPFLQDLLSAAKADGMDLLIASAYRSFETQASIKAVNATKFGTTKANSFSADQGYSEHQLGTTVDFTTAKIGENFGAIVNLPENVWLSNNAYKYGFVLSYPKGNTYYIYEPWHWRFVGVALATRLRQEGKYFYDTEQNIIDSYLVDMFEKK